MRRAVIAFVGLLLGVGHAAAPAATGPLSPPVRSPQPPISSTDLLVWRPETGVWYGTNSGPINETGAQLAKQFGDTVAGDKPVPGDIDGDGITDLILWRNSTATWSWRTSGNGYGSPAGSQPLGQSGDKPLVADIDGDGMSDLIVWRPATGTWYWLKSSNGYTGTPFSKQWGLNGDIPLTGDMDGDGKNDLMVWRPSTGVWFWLTSSSSYNSSFNKQWGANGDVPIAARMDGDAKSEIMVWRPSTTTWYWMTSTSGYTAWSSVLWGSNGDVPFAGDVDGDGLSELMLWRGTTATWNWLTSSTGYALALAESKPQGVSTDTPLTPSVKLLRLQRPVISPAEGVYTNPIDVSIGTPTVGAQIFYTVDGTDPTALSSVYSQPIPLSTTTQVRARTSLDGYPLSDVTAADYTWNLDVLPAPTIAPLAGSYDGPVTVTLSAAAGATIRYTTDGSTPTAASAAYSAPFSLVASATVKARAWHPSYAPSAEASAAYVISVASPTFSLADGTYAPGQRMTVSSATPGALITYTLNGATPTVTDAAIASGGTVVVGSYTIKAKAWKSGVTPSAVSTGTYVVSGQIGVFGGPMHSAALRPDGTVWAWGDNVHGAVGDGTNVARRNPVQVATLANVRSISVGQWHSVALMPDATVKSWGVNISGEVGDGTTADRWSPVAVPGLKNVVAIDAGVSFTLALQAGGNVLTWGFNGQGQLGDGSLSNRLSPVAIPNLTNVVAVAGGLDHSVVLKSDGTVWAWGDNARGQVGDGTTTRRTSPVQVSGLTNVVAIDAGYWSSLAMKNDGTVWRWGSNSLGEIGDGTTTDRTTPVQMSGITNATAAAARYRFTEVLKADQTVWTVGDNSEGQLGTPGPNRSIAAQVTSLPAMAFLRAADVNGYPMTADLTVWAWGRNSYGNIGDGTTTVRTSPVQISGPNMVWRAWTPVITLASGQYIGEQSAVITNGDASSVMHFTITGVDPTESDPVIAAGSGVPITNPLTLKVRSFKAGAPPSDIASATYTLKVAAPTMSPAGGTFSSAQTVAISTITGSSAIRYTTDGRLPSGTSTLYTAPLTVATPTLIKAIATRSGWVSSDATSATYWVTTSLAAPTIFPSTGSFGTERVVTITPGEANASTRYTFDGTDPTAQSPLYQRPFLVAQTVTIKARSFKTGFAASAVTTATLTIAASGLSAPATMAPVGGRYTTQRTVSVTGAAGATLRYTTNGADPTDTDPTIASGGTILVDRSMVVKVRVWQAGLAPSVVAREDYVITGAISAGETYSIALKADGTVWTWGDNFYGQLGDGGTAGRNTPYQVLSGATAIAAGYRHALALKVDGTVWAWGENYVGEVGDGTTTKRRSPVQVPGLTNVVAIAGGFVNSYALKADGTLWGWGANWGGQLGDGTTNGRLTPTQVPGLSGVQAIAAGEGFVLAIVSHGGASGALWAWGANNVGQLGDATTTNRLVPQPVAGATAVNAVFAGRAWSAARTVNDELLLWGVNDFGQQANGARTDGYNNFNSYFATRAAPWAAPFATIGGGYNHVLVAGKTGQLWGWGNNWECELAASPCQTQRLTGELIPAFPLALAATGGGLHSLAIAPTGQLWSWGRNDSGQLGVTVGGWLSTPQSVVSLVDNSFLTADQDGDGLPTWREYLLGTDPLFNDTDGDGIPDGIDVLSGDRANDLDPDHDGLSTARELAWGTDAYNADTDGDGVMDGADAFPLDPSRSQAPPVDPNDHTPPVITLIYPSNARPIGGGL